MSRRRALGFEAEEVPHRCAMQVSGNTAARDPLWRMAASLSGEPCRLAATPSARAILPEQ